MRLLHTTTHQMHDFGDHNKPLYAILSHRWREEEVSFQDVQSGQAPHKKSYDKVAETCRLAASHGFDYVWIDTCCIDKTNSSELSEAINSMYYWYETCTVCYAYLADISGGTSSSVRHEEKARQLEGEARDNNHYPIESREQKSARLRHGAVSSTITDTAVLDESTVAEFTKSEWFERGWTLQELIAPLEVIFLNRDWKGLGIKTKISAGISNITGIPEHILQGDHPEEASVAQRMSWASKRKTTRIEDRAYCLMGIFGINIPMLYGEREKAFLRLQEEILKTSDDHSIFAWEYEGEQTEHGIAMSCGLLAPSVDCFVNSSDIVPDMIEESSRGTITVTNKGIHIEVPVSPEPKYAVDTSPILNVDDNNRVRMAVLPCVRVGKW